jgi:hypothetical protein
MRNAGDSQVISFIEEKFTELNLCVQQCDCKPVPSGILGIFSRAATE